MAEVENEELLDYDEEDQTTETQAGNWAQPEMAIDLPRPCGIAEISRETVKSLETNFFWVLGWISINFDRLG